MIAVNEVIEATTSSGVEARIETEGIGRTTVSIEAETTKMKIRVLDAALSGAAGAAKNTTPKS